jgi:hypothetical protein
VLIEKYLGGNGLQIELFGLLGMFFQVDEDYSRPIFVLFLEFFQDRGHHLAGYTAVCPQINHGHLIGNRYIGCLGLFSTHLVNGDKNEHKAENEYNFISGHIFLPSLFFGKLAKNLCIVNRAFGFYLVLTTISVY